MQKLEVGLEKNRIAQAGQLVRDAVGIRASAQILRFVREETDLEALRERIRSVLRQLRQNDLKEKDVLPKLIHARASRALAGRQ